MKWLEAKNRIRDLSSCNEGGLLWLNKLDHPISISWGNLREWGGRGGVGCQSGIGGVKSKPVLLEFLVAVNVKKCTILGVKRVVPLVYRGGGCNSYTRIWGHFEPFWGRFWGLVKTHYIWHNNTIATYTRTYFASPRDSVSYALYVTFARALCFFQNRDTIFIASFFIYNTSIYFRWFPLIRWHTSSSFNKLVLLPSGDAIRACPPAILSCETIGYSQFDIWSIL